MSGNNYTTHDPAISCKVIINEGLIARLKYRASSIIIATETLLIYSFSRITYVWIN
ncbi:hypothetical protein [Desulfurella multipotens]|uniref:hypothetical protein n=1 Tax=Desulfurella multipotens TaxID=79269 RepID=UPI00135638CB|nr:hypothetical protein [Desulfurella multipotens]